jgi:hypothetical protein
MNYDLKETTLGKDRNMKEIRVYLFFIARARLASTEHLLELGRIIPHRNVFITVNVSQHKHVRP